jgi:glycosyltransferase involved in cell wall biosynthesis
MGGFGMNAYTFELAEGLASQGVHVDVYTSDASSLEELPLTRNHRCFPVLGSALFKQQLTAWRPSRAVSADAVPQNSPDKVEPHAVRSRKFWTAARDQFLQLELALHLKRQGYDLVWTQWPHVYGPNFCRLCKVLGMTTAHTVHNVLPHEEEPQEVRSFQEFYPYPDLLFVHSEWTKNELSRLFPQLRNKVLIAPHGVYTVYPRKPEARQQVRKQLNIPDGHVTWLFCGAIRPYKNIESVLEALANERCAKTVLIVAGREAGYANSCPADPLARTRRTSSELGVAERVRLIPGYLPPLQLAELFEAADILALPYLKHYGSGLLLLGMTFGKHVVATDTGGTREYLSHYPRSTLLESADPASVTEGLLQASHAVSIESDIALPGIPELQWPAIARNVLTMLENIASHR